MVSQTLMNATQMLLREDEASVVLDLIIEEPTLVLPLSSEGAPHVKVTADMLRLAHFPSSVNVFPIHKVDSPHCTRLQSGCARTQRQIFTSSSSTSGLQLRPLSGSKSSPLTFTSCRSVMGGGRTSVPKRAAAAATMHAGTRRQGHVYGGRPFCKWQADETDVF
ncbi:hypothetical protein GN958_ATG02553 [Phytophthora infestans]|uniref:Uncharacterized protein n=1 Tax=Phytophthora infestans TaxID=4787 RepID=A0A8S9VAJ8_PHYIN|nr:hypothetical protein GN958_ATG02553 [Phytophthora infestans]